MSRNLELKHSANFKCVKSFVSFNVFFFLCRINYFFKSRLLLFDFCSQFYSLLNVVSFVSEVQSFATVVFQKRLMLKLQKLADSFQDQIFRFSHKHELDSFVPNIRNNASVFTFKAKCKSAPIAVSQSFAARDGIYPVPADFLFLLCQ